MKNPHLRALLSISALLVSVSTTALAVEEPVQLTSGQVSGVELDGNVTVFRGIPFAAPPVGDLRWKAPQPPIPWRGVRVADTFGATCMQRGRQLMSEDCLYLNVWTKADSDQDRLPVMVWIHGGGWTFGASSSANYDGVGFADKGVVLVSVNYRMSAFGFMAHPELSAESARGVSGNYGILDHIAALEWVRDNIRGFGGDPDNVTIFGESAGGASIYALLATPLANGLFHRAISESTWITGTNVTHLTRHNGFSDSAEARGQQAVADKLTELGRSTDGDLLATMRAMSADDVISMRFGVSLAEDGWVLPKSPEEIFSDGSHNVVPLLAGVNDGEGLFFVRPNRTFSKTPREARANFAKNRTTRGWRNGVRMDRASPPTTLQRRRTISSLPKSTTAPIPCLRDRIDRSSPRWRAQRLTASCICLREICVTPTSGRPTPWSWDMCFRHCLIRPLRWTEKSPT